MASFTSLPHIVTNVALYGAQITAGIMGGFWLLTTLLEVFQLKGRPHHHATNTVDSAGQTTVVPSTKNTSSHGISTSNIGNPNLVSTSTSSAHLTSAPTPATAPAHIHRDGIYQPEMTSYQAHENNNQFQQQYYQPTPMPQPQQFQQQQYQQAQPTPQMHYQQVQQTPQPQYQQVQQTPQQAYQPSPVPQPAQPHQLQQPYPTHPTPVAELYPPQSVSADTFPSAGSGTGSTNYAH
ncbi:hypothetical protein BGZ47_003897 [Haplosporangium gracile]|nr:hypothetical protein BGZ47_003897 [Haplosporangium gracile]